MSQIILEDKDLIAKGGERACYIDPRDNSKVIKVLYIKSEDNRQNELEYIYMKHLDKKKKDLSAVTKCYGYVNTNKGKGLVFDRVLDYDLQTSKSLRYYMVNKLIDLKTQEKLLLELKKYLEQNGILFVDTSLTNIFCQKLTDSNYKLIIVDGLGAKRIGIKFWLYQHCKLYAMYKIKRQWSKLTQMYNKDIIRIKLGKHPIIRL